MATRELPQVGEVWRERRRQYARRTVRVTAVDSDLNGFVYTETITTANGRAPTRPVRNRVRANLWHKSWTKD